MKYTILTLGNPEREKYREEIRRQMSTHEEVFVECVNGKDAEQLNSNIERHGFDINFPEWRPGEGGVWYSNINAWEYCANQKDDLMIFEDDAILHDEFGLVINQIEPPENYDFITYYIPYYSPNMTSPTTLVNTYQEHGNVCIVYSPAGARKILNLLELEGLEWPVDIWLFKKALAGDLKGYSPKVHSVRIVDADLEIPSNIHNDERILVHKKDNANAV